MCSLWTGPRHAKSDRRAHAGVDEEPDDRPAPAEHPRDRRRDRGAVEDEGRGIVDEGVSLEDDDDAPRDGEPRNDRRRRDGDQSRDPATVKEEPP